jgi:leader peptidase (prepilin peptidase)/N-methyltransferase
VWDKLIIDLIALIFGLIFGSFYNVLIYRVPKDLSIVKPERSFCPVCKHQLEWKDNIPILSYLFLRGRCRYCGSKISIVYPLVEGSTALLFLLSAYLTNDIFSMIALWLLFSGAIIITVIDFQTMLIPDFAVIMTAAGGALWALMRGHLIVSLITAAVVFGIFFLIHLFSKNGMGFGDVEYIGALALYLTPISIVWAVLIASVSAIIFTIPMLATHKANRKTRVPFGPFLAIGVSIAIFVKFL